MAIDKSTDSKDISNALDSAINSDADSVSKATPLRCFLGALTSSLFSLLAYRLLVSIADSFASHPIMAKSSIAANISAAVRTLVQGIVALGAGVFGVAALGLAALGVQLLFMGKPEGEAG